MEVIFTHSPLLCELLDEISRKAEEHEWYASEYLAITITKKHEDRFEATIVLSKEAK